jgi:hypothetical protein
MEREFILADELREFRRYKELAEKALAQISDADLFRCVGEESNSIAMVMKHIAGNLRSRWTDFLTTDGEKLNRNRDSEFVIGAADTRHALLENWNSGWQCMFDVLERLTPADMAKSVTIRAEPYTVPQAVLRSLGHCAYHIGQIVFLAKHFAANRWDMLTVPRGKSEEHFELMRKKFAGTKGSE